MKIILQYKKIAFVLLAVMALLFTSCQEDLLEPVPQDQISDANAYQTPERIQRVLLSVYASLKGGQLYGGRYLVYNDIRGEEFLNESSNGVTGLQTWNHTIISNTNEVNNLWNQAYLTINRVNVFVANVEANKAIINNDKTTNAYIGEARLIRALCYHSLLMLYARPYADGMGSKPGVPLRLTPQVGLGGNDLPRATVAEVYAQILDDLNFAEQNLPLNYSTPYLNTTRAHRNTAIALKTRVYLHMGRYADVITEANKIVPATAPFKAPSGVAHELQADIAAVFRAPYTTTESIFSMPFTENNLPGTQNGLGSYYNPGPRGIGDYSLNRAGIIGDSVNFPVTDARRRFIIINTPGNGRPYFNKFPTSLPNNIDYVPVIRYAEVLLNLAEALSRSGGDQARALALLNAVRGRSNPAGVYTSFADATALTNAILLERRIELLGEGFRAPDLMRQLLPLPAKVSVAGSAPAVAPTQSEYIWPIPNQELLTNKLAQQNP
jgi:hypothetical protein